MSVQPSANNDYLYLNTVLRDAVHFVNNNKYFKPQPSIDLVEEFEAVFRQLLNNSQTLMLLPESNIKATLEAISGTYTFTYRGLTALYMSAPVPEDAAGWFDYQKELRARQTFLKNLQILLNWHVEFFDEIVSNFPFLPIPFPVQQGRKDNQALQSNLNPRLDADTESAASGGNNNDDLPEAFLE